MVGRAQVAWQGRKGEGKKREAGVDVDGTEEGKGRGKVYIFVSIEWKRKGTMGERVIVWVFIDEGSE